MGLFSTFFYNDMPLIYQVHSLNVWYRLGISKVYHWDLHIQGIFIVYTLYIRGIYMIYRVTSTNLRNIHCIYLVYTWNIHGIYTVIQWHLYIELNNIIEGIFIVYIMYIHYIYYDIHYISCAYAPPGGWCCGGGQGPIPPAPPAMHHLDESWL
jgi:hypothetical protein